VADTREIDLGSSIAEGESLPQNRTSTRLRAKIDQSARQATNIAHSHFLTGISTRGNSNLLDTRSRFIHDIPVTQVNYETQDISYECVHPDYRLDRMSFDGQNHTLGIAAHDKKSKSDVIYVVPYISDIYQHLFSNEVREEKYFSPL